MDLKEQIIKEYLEQGCGYGKLQAKYGIGRTTIYKRAQSKKKWIGIVKMSSLEKGKVAIR